MTLPLDEEDPQNLHPLKHRTQDISRIFHNEGVNDETLKSRLVGAVCTSKYQHSIKARHFWSHYRLQTVFDCVLRGCLTHPGNAVTKFKNIRSVIKIPFKAHCGFIKILFSTFHPCLPTQLWGLIDEEQQIKEERTKSEGDFLPECEYSRLKKGSVTPFVWWKQHWCWINVFWETLEQQTVHFILLQTTALIS